MDHVIISETEFLSFDEAGMMESIKKSPLYTILSKEKHELELDALKTEVEKEKAAYNRAVEIAKKVKEMVYGADLIKELTGWVRYRSESCKMRVNNPYNHYLFHYNDVI